MNINFNYERQSFDISQQNWPDFRDGVSTTAAKVCGLAWCHGAPGIALSRLKANQAKADAVFVQEMNVKPVYASGKITLDMTNEPTGVYLLMVENSITKLIKL